MRPRSFSSFSVVAVAIGLIITACTATQDPSVGPSGSQAEPTTDPSGAPSSAPTGGTLRVAVADFGSESLDPAMEGRSTTLNQTLQMWDTLLEIGPDGGLAPGVAEDWEVSDDGLTWTFYLREGIEFHDGWGELTAEDVKFSIERFMNEKAVASAASLWRDAVDTITVVDPYTVEIKTKAVSVTLPYFASPHQSEGGIIFSSRYLLEEAGEDFDAQTALLNEHPIGSGPFEFVSHTLGDSMVFAAVEDHWRATPRISELEIILVPEPATQLAMLQSGEADVITISGDQISQVEEAGMEVRSIERALSVGVLFPGTYRPPAGGLPTADPTVRRALSYAIDREAILESVLQGQGTLPTTPYVTLPSTLDIDESAYSDWAQETATFDPDLARELLADAGYADGFSGVPMHLFARPGTAFLPDLGEIIAAQWAEVGAEFELVATDYDQYRDHLSRAPIDDAYNAAAPAPFSSGPRFDGVVALDSYWLFEEGNVQLLQDPELDALIQQARSETDDELRRDLVTQAFTIANDSWVVLSLFDMNALFAVNPDVVGEWQVYPGYAVLGRTYETIQAAD